MSVKQITERPCLKDFEIWKQAVREKGPHGDRNAVERLRQELMDGRAFDPIAAAGDAS